MEIGIKEAKNRLSELLDRVEAGETITLTKHGKPVALLRPHVEQRGQGINRAAVEQFKAALGLDELVSYIAPDFDDPLPEDFLITPASSKTSDAA